MRVTLLGMIAVTTAVILMLLLGTYLDRLRHETKES
jgi:hypothetical protein